MSVHVTLTVVEACEANTLTVSALLVISGIVTTSVPHLSTGGTCSISMSQGGISRNINLHTHVQRRQIPVYLLLYECQICHHHEPEGKMSEISSFCSSENQDKNIKNLPFDEGNEQC